MKKINEYKGIIIIVLVLILGAFYWYQVRPTQIIKACWNRVEKIKNYKTPTKLSDFKTIRFSPDSFATEYLINKIKLGDQEAINNIYSNCLREKGINK